MSRMDLKCVNSSSDEREYDDYNAREFMYMPVNIKRMHISSLLVDRQSNWEIISLFASLPAFQCDTLLIYILVSAFYPLI